MSTEIENKIRDSYAKLSQSLPQFKPRREQNFLIAQIAKTLLKDDDSSKIIVAEAGTGIGKSLAYLQAAVPCAIHAKKKLVISTATITLQEQLIEKDLPLYQKIAAEPHTYILVKGRQRYCCAHRLAQATQGEFTPLDFDQLLSHPPDPQDHHLLKKLWQSYQAGDWNGDRDAWPDAIPEPLWQLITSERHSCQRGSSHHSQCPFQKARQNIDATDVLVVNHALLIADLQMGGGVILPNPEDCFYVIDEAHHFPLVARNQGASQASLRYTIKWIEQFDQFLRGGLKQTLAKLDKYSLKSNNTPLPSCLEALTQLLQWSMSNPQFFAQENIFRFPNRALPETIITHSQSLEKTTAKILQLIDKQLSALSDGLKSGELERKNTDPLLYKLSIYQQRFTNLHKLWRLINQSINENGPPIAHWLERTERDIVIHASPIESGAWLEKNLWLRAGGVVLMSATLCALNSFDFFQRQCGLHVFNDVEYLRLSSPFDYQKSHLYVPQMHSDPSSEDFTDVVAKKLEQLIVPQTTHLVLFSSYQQMQYVFDKLCKKIDIPIFMQGQKSQAALIRAYKKCCHEEKHGVLFGTASFTEGLDLPGQYLTRLIITKIPFAVPTSPIEASTAEWLEQQGKNPFMHLTVPEASRKLIQACGRLIRQESDQGEIYLLDRRIVTRRYGKAMLNALPPFTRHVEL